MQNGSVDDLIVFLKLLTTFPNDDVRLKQDDTPTVNLMLSARKIGENSQIDLSSMSTFPCLHHLIFRL